MKKIIWVLVILVLASLWFWLKDDSAKEVTGSKIKIGSVMPLSGDFAAFGEEILRGEQIAVDEALKEGWDLSFVSEDDQSKPTGSVNAANKLVRVDKVDAVTTAILQQVKPMVGIFSNTSVPLLAVWDSNEYIKSAGDNVFTIGFSTEHAGEIMAEYAYNTLKLRSVAVINAQDEWSGIIAGAFAKKFTALGGKIALTEQVLPDLKEFRTQVAKIKGAKADGIYAPLFPTTIAPLLKQVSEQGLNVKFMTADSFSQDELDGAGGAGEGIYFSNLYADDTKALDAKYKAKYGTDSAASVFVTFGYDGIRTLLEAKKISQSKGVTMLEAMRQVDIRGTDTRIKMNGNRYSEKFERIYQVQNGEFVEVSR